MFIIDLIVILFSKTIGAISWPWVDKKFNLNHYFELEKELAKLPVPFAIAVVNTYGHGTNLLIKATQIFSKDKRKRKSNKSHAMAFISFENGRFKTVEMVGDGLRVVSLLSSIGQRDEVKIRIPNYKLMNESVCKHALQYIIKAANEDENQNIEYNIKHDLEDKKRYDCSGIIYHAVSYGFEMAGQKNLLKTANRGGKKAWAPVEAEFSELFVDLYDSKKGFL